MSWVIWKFLVNDWIPIQKSKSWSRGGRQIAGEPMAEPVTSGKDVKSLKKFFEQQASAAASAASGRGSNTSGLPRPVNVIKAPASLNQSRTTTSTEPSRSSSPKLFATRVSVTGRPEKPVKPLHLKQTAVQVLPAATENPFDSPTSVTSQTSFNGVQRPPQNVGSSLERDKAENPFESPLATVKVTLPTRVSSISSESKPALLPRPSPTLKSNTPSVASTELPMLSPRPTTGDPRDPIIKELLDSEAQYIKDLQVLVQVYVIPCQEKEILSRTEIKTLFGNVESIIPVASSLLQALQRDTLGSVFLEQAPKLSTVYTEYCKNHEAALQKMNELTTDPEIPEKVKTFLTNAQASLKGKTGAWDLGSLLIKPVQRILKYPLLIKQLIKATPSSDPDFESLKESLSVLEDMAERINDVKKRKDIVDKYVEGKGSLNVMHGITKKINRGTQQLKMVTGLVEESQHDETWDQIISRFDYQYKGFQNLDKLLAAWIKSVKDYLEYKEALVLAWEEVYAAGLGHPSIPRPTQELDILKKYRQAAFQLANQAWKEAETSLKASIKPALVQALSAYRDPLLIIKKRDAKKLDFERLQGLKARGEPIDKSLLESAEAYESLHAQLLEELPLFTTIMSEVMDSITVKIAELQKSVFEQIRTVFKRLGGFESLLEDALNSVTVNEKHEHILDEYRSNFQVDGVLESKAKDISLFTRWKAEIFDPIRTGLPLTLARTPIKKQHSLPNIVDSPKLSGTDDGLLRVGSPSPRARTLSRSHSKMNTYTSENPLEMTPTAPPLVDSIEELVDSFFDAVVIYPYFASHPKEISLELGQVLVITKVSKGKPFRRSPFDEDELSENDSDGEEWWFGEHARTGKSGWFPSKFAQRR